MGPVLEWRAYFLRQASVQGIGTEGLERLRNARVAVVGCGGVGSAAADYLARSGIGYLRLIDQDIVDLSNLHRLHGASASDIYQPKAEVIANALSRNMPWLKIEAIVDTAREANVEELLGSVELIVDGLDNFRTRYVLNNYSIRTRVPYLFTSAIANQGHAALFQPPNNACLECIFPSLASRPNESCESLGVTSSVVATIGAIAANEAVKFLLGQTSRLASSLLTLDLAGPDFVFSKLSKKPDCRECGVAPPAKGSGSDHGEVSILCGENTANIIPRKMQKLDLERISLRLGAGEVLACSANVLVYRENNLVVSLFRNGRLIIQGVTSEDDARVKSSQVLERLGIVTAATQEIVSTKGP